MQATTSAPSQARSDPTTQNPTILDPTSSNTSIDNNNFVQSRFVPSIQPSRTTTTTQFSLCGTPPPAVAPLRIVAPQFRAPTPPLSSTHSHSSAPNSHLAKHDAAVVARATEDEQREQQKLALSSSSSAAAAAAASVRPIAVGVPQQQQVTQKKNAVTQQYQRAKLRQIKPVKPAPAAPTAAAPVASNKAKSSASSSSVKAKSQPKSTKTHTTARTQSKKPKNPSPPLKQNTNTKSKSNTATGTSRPTSAAAASKSKCAAGSKKSNSHSRKSSLNQQHSRMRHERPQVIRIDSDADSASSSHTASSSDDSESESPAAAAADKNDNADQNSDASVQIEESQEQYTVECVCDEDFDPVKRCKMYKVFWVGWPNYSWEPAKCLRACPLMITQFRERRAARDRGEIQSLLAPAPASAYPPTNSLLSVHKQPKRYVRTEDHKTFAQWDAEENAKSDALWAAAEAKDMAKRERRAVREAERRKRVAERNEARLQEKLLKDRIKLESGAATGKRRVKIEAGAGKKRSTSSTGAQFTVKRENCDADDTAAESFEFSSSDDEQPTIVMQPHRSAEHPGAQSLRASPECLTRFNLLRGGGGLGDRHQMYCLDLFELHEVSDSQASGGSSQDNDSASDSAERAQLRKAIAASKADLRLQHTALHGTHTADEAVREVQRFEREQANRQKSKAKANSSLATKRSNRDSAPPSPTQAQRRDSKQKQRPIKAILPFDMLTPLEINDDECAAEFDAIRAYSSNRRWIGKQQAQCKVEPESVVDAQHCLEEMLAIHDVRISSSGNRIEYLVQWHKNTQTKSHSVALGDGEYSWENADAEALRPPCRIVDQFLDEHWPRMVRSQRRREQQANDMSLAYNAHRVKQEQESINLTRDEAVEAQPKESRHENSTAASVVAPISHSQFVQSFDLPAVSGSTCAMHDSQSVGPPLRFDSSCIVVKSEPL